MDLAPVATASPSPPLSPPPVCHKKIKTVSFDIREKEIENDCKSEMANFSVLDTKPSHVLDFPLTVCQQIWLIFFLPTLALLVIYIGDVATDIGVGVALIIEGEIPLGAVTLGLLYLPAVVSFVLKISRPPDTREGWIAATWLLVEFAALILFPIRILYCIGERLFWSVEALRREDPEREEALVGFEATRAQLIENHLFFQAFLQAGPQAILQFLLLILNVSEQKETQVVQAASVMTSLLMVALVTSSYQRYETQVRGGRPQVWHNRDRSFSNLLLEVTGTPSEGGEGLQQQREQPRRRWVKVMEEDNPIGRLVSFTFWFLFLFSRLASLVTAALFFPYVVLGLCSLHYLVIYIYILPSPDCSTGVIAKLFLALLSLFCLVEVKVTFRKSYLLYSLFFILSFLENLGLTLLWGLAAHWSGQFYYYTFYVLASTQALALFFLFVYFKFLKPQVKRLEPMQ